jgi:hypothetical protein
MIALGLGGGATALPSGGASVALAVGAASTVYGVLGGAFFDAWNAGQDPSWIDEPYDSQLHHMTGL